jgi:cytochrome oxidase Cu insertion factor (SCO1/SenC/PrrC family)
MKKILNGVTRWPTRTARQTCATLILCGLSALCVNVAAAQPAAGSRAKPRPQHEHHRQPPKAPTQTPQTPKELTIPDVSVFTQEGREIKFYTELVKDKVVLINFFYTTCKAACPMSGERLATIQKSLGDRVGKDVHLISVSTDPETDTPAKLKDWSRKFDAQTGWTFVTGGPTEMSALLQALAGRGPSKDFHLPSVYVINDRSGGWVYTSLLQAPANLLRTIDELANQPRQRAAR